MFVSLITSCKLIQKMCNFFCVCVHCVSSALILGSFVDNDEHALVPNILLRET